MGPFKVSEIISKNAVRIELPDNINVHPIVHVEHTARAFTKRSDISRLPLEKARSYIDVRGDNVIEVERILAHRRRGSGFQFLTLFRNAPFHEASWKPLRDFLDLDGTITQTPHTYIIEYKMLHHLH